MSVVTLMTVLGFVKSALQHSNIVIEELSLVSNGGCESNQVKPGRYVCLIVDGYSWSVGW